MTWRTIQSVETDADSPIDEFLMTDGVKANLDYLKSAVTDAGSASQAISTTTAQSSGTLTGGGDLVIAGDLNSGNLTVGGTFTPSAKVYASDYILYLTGY